MQNLLVLSVGLVGLFATLTHGLTPAEEESLSLYREANVVSGVGADGEERTVFTSGGNYFIALNTTYLLFYAALFGIGLLTALALASLFAPAAPAASASGYGYQQSSGYSSGESQHQQYRRKRGAHLDSGKETAQTKASSEVEWRV